MTAVAHSQTVSKIRPGVRPRVAHPVDANRDAVERDDDLPELAAFVAVVKPAAMPAFAPPGAAASHDCDCNQFAFRL